VILLGGATGVGKSTIATMLSLAARDHTGHPHRRDP